MTACVWLLCGDRGGVAAGECGAPVHAPIETPAGLLLWLVGSMARQLRPAATTPPRTPPCLPLQSTITAACLLLFRRRASTSVTNQHHTHALMCHPVVFVFAVTRVRVWCLCVRMRTTPCC